MTGRRAIDDDRLPARSATGIGLERVRAHPPEEHEFRKAGGGGKELSVDLAPGDPRGQGPKPNGVLDVIIHGPPGLKVHHVEPVLRRSRRRRVRIQRAKRLADANEERPSAPRGRKGGEPLRNGRLADAALPQNEEGPVEVEGAAAGRNGSPFQNRFYFNRVSIERRPSVESGK